MLQPKFARRPGRGGGGQPGHRHPVQGPADGEAGRDAGAHQVAEREQRYHNIRCFILAACHETLEEVKTL